MLIVIAMPLDNLENLPQNGRLMGIDFGDKAIGLALSDIGQRIASPYSVVRRGKWGVTKDELLKIINDNEVCAAVIGLPLMPDGTYGDTASKVMAFADLVEKDLGLPVLMWDERLSTKMAENAMFEQRVGRQTRASKKDVKRQGLDAVAAAIILQGVLDAKI